MICESCRTEFIVSGSIKYLGCPCGGVHAICGLCVGSLVSDGYAHYSDPSKSLKRVANTNRMLPEPKLDVVLDVCPRAMWVARMMLG